MGCNTSVGCSLGRAQCLAVLHRTLQERSKGTSEPEEPPMLPPCRPHVTTTHPPTPLRLKVLWLHQTKGPSVVPSQARKMTLDNNPRHQGNYCLDPHFKDILSHIIYLCSCMCRGTHVHGKIRGQLLGLAFPFQCTESQGSNSGHHV